ncbi:MAG: Maf family nucleotide pyrophosphatase [Betaproteobacteria bacterium]
MDRIPPLVLASTSRYRSELLSRLRLTFDVAAPDADETPLPGESCRETALRLATAKARSLHVQYPAALIIGADQVADLDGEAIGKPGNFTNALRQLQRMRGRTVVFHTAVALFDSRTGAIQLACTPTTVAFRKLPDDALGRYLELEAPYDCAGSAKAEALGIALTERIESSDPTALIGLPLIALTSMFATAGFALF